MRVRVGASSELFKGRSAVAAAATFGVGIVVALRFYVILHPVGALDADEAITGLMAKHVLDGEISVFYWGQNYGGSLEPLITAGLFAVFGSSVFALRAVPVLLSIVTAIVVWRIGLRMGSRFGGVVAATLFLAWPGWSVWKSLRAHAFYGVLALTSSLLILVALQIRDKPSIKRYLLFGFVTGVGWWASPQIALVAVPVVVWLVVVIRDWRFVAFTGLAFLAGTAPWLLWNLTNEWASVTQLPDLPDTSYLERFTGFWTHVLPTALAVRVPRVGSWVTATATSALVAYAVALAAFLWFVFISIVQRDWVRVLFGSTLVAYPFLYAASPFTWYLDEPRYLVPFLVVACVIIGTAAGKSIAVLTVVITAVLPLSALQLVAMEEQDALDLKEEGILVPADFSPLLETLESEQIDRVLAEYWIAYRITFESDERVIATSTTHVRYPPHDQLVRNDSFAAFVFLEGANDEKTFLATTFYQRSFRKLTAGPFSIYEPTN